MNLCMRFSAVAVASRGEDDVPSVRESSVVRGRAAELHRQLSHLREPVIVPRDEFTINLNFERSGREPSADASVRPTSSSHASTSSSTAAVPKDGVGPQPPSPPPTATPAPAPDAGQEAMDGVMPNGHGAAAGDDAALPLGGSASRRGFVRVKSVKPPEGLAWTHSRRCLELLITAERDYNNNINRTASSGGDGSTVYQSHEQRLRERLERLQLEMLIVAGDGNCQFRSISNELYGSQAHHAIIRRHAVEHIAARREVFECFLGEDFDDYVQQMGRSGTWGDELTLRAVCDSYGIIVHVVTSDEGNWYLTYMPECRKLDREIFLTYIAPIHYNSIKRQSSLKTMALTLSRSFKSLGSSSLRKQQQQQRG
ncbi:hypothetical protein Agub_g6628, partial [Astrephomene gubernaculifera]